MRAAGISEFGGAVGRIDLPDPRPLADDEVLIEMRAAGVGNYQEFVRTGDWDVGRAPPMALGVGSRPPRRHGDRRFRQGLGAGR